MRALVDKVYASLLASLDAVWTTLRHTAFLMCGGGGCVDPVASLTLTYSDASSSALLSVRDTLDYGHVVYQDRRVTADEFKKMKTSLPFRRLPCLDVGSQSLGQSKALLRYAGRLAHTYPTHNPVHMALVDGWLELHSEFCAPLVLQRAPERMGCPAASVDFVATSQKVWCQDEHIPRFQRMLTEELTRHKWLGGFDTPTVADFCWVPTLEWLLDDGEEDGLRMGDDVSVLRAYTTSFRIAVAEGRSSKTYFT